MLKARLVTSMAERTRRIESGEQVVVGVNDFVETTASPLGGDAAILRVDPAVEEQAVAALATWRAERDDVAVKDALDELRRVTESGGNVMPASIALAKAGGTTGEWGALMRDVFGEYRAPTGVGLGPNRTRRARRGRRVRAHDPGRATEAARRQARASTATRTAPSRSRSPPATPGWRSSTPGIRLTPEQIAASARDEDPDVIGISILSGSHLELVPEVIERCRAEGVDAAIVVGGIIPEEDRARLLDAGVAAVYTPKDFRLADIMRDIAELTAARRARD